MLQTIGIGDFNGRPCSLSVGDDFVLVDGVANLPYAGQPFRCNLLLFFFCAEGKARFSLETVDCDAVSLNAGDVLCLRPNQPVYQILLSSDSKICVLGYSPKVVDYFLTARDDIWGMLDTAFQKPVLHYGQRFMNERLMGIIDMLRQRSTNPHLRFREQESVHIFATLLFEVINQAISIADSDNTISEQRIGRTDSIFRDFINCLNASGGRQRTVSYFADALCISPKHLSKIIKEKTGKKAISVITDHAIEQIKLDLKLSDAPISHLADKYGFSNFSFFCQFVKKHLGKQPMEYRRG